MRHRRSHEPLPRPSFGTNQVSYNLVNQFFIVGPRGFETLLFHEIRHILENSPCSPVKQYGGIAVSGSLEDAYRVCLYSRLTNRVFAIISEGSAENEQQLYDLVHEIEWEQHFLARNSLSVGATTSSSKLSHSQFIALKAKDAIVDRFRSLPGGSRPDVDRKSPDIRIQIQLHRNRVTVSLDLSGGSLHLRGYRQQHAGAPLKENLAAAILHQAGWTAAELETTRLVDPMCGSGTLAIEAAMMAANMAPGLKRQNFGFEKWLRHDNEVWENLLEDAQQQVNSSCSAEIIASDRDGKAVKIARENARRAGVETMIEFQTSSVQDLSLPKSEKTTLLVTNPPYGQRLTAEQGLAVLYEELGNLVRRHQPARLTVISANPDQLHRLQLAGSDRKSVRNGPIDCVLASFDTSSIPLANSDSPPEHKVKLDEQLAAPLRNRLQKNLKHIERWARRSGVSCFRAYDADLPEFSFALDVYGSEINPDERWLLLQEYQAPKQIDADKVRLRWQTAIEVARQVLSVDDRHVFLKTRQRQKGRQQYQKQGQVGEYFRVREGEASLLVNLSDYLDSGLFLDHREVRQRVAELARNRHLLNLFCYTGSVGVQAALSEAATVTNVDLSNTYLQWAEENFAVNGFDDGSRYYFMQADVLKMLKQPRQFDLRDRYDVIFLDPPSFSNSKRMLSDLDVLRDHETMIRQAMQLLEKDGTLVFSCNRRGFQLNESLQAEFHCKDITRQTLPEDFKRNPKIHSCWEISHV